MGLLHSFVDWGIQVIDNVETDVGRIAQRLGYMPLSWRQVVMQNPAKAGLLWRIPDPEVRMANTLANVQALLVTNYEQVMVFGNGVRMGREPIPLPPGLYDLRRVQMRDQLEIVWITSQEFQLRWGVANALTKDRVSIGASGTYRAVITNPELFLLHVAGHGQVYKEEQLAAHVKADVTGTVRDFMARMDVMEFQSARQELLNACQERLQPIFDRWGLEFRGLSIEHQQIPEQYLQAAQGRTIVTMEKEAQLEAAKMDIVLAQLEAQKSLYLTQAEANKRLSLGRVEVELMREQQLTGIDPLAIKRIEAIDTLAANPGQGTLFDARPQIVSQIMGQPSTPLLESHTVTGSIAPPLSSGALTSGRVPAASSPTDERQKIQAMLDQLDEQLVTGKITEQKHSELYNRFQKKLSELP